MRCTHPRLNRCTCPDNTKLACHRRARYKMEWIYTQTKVSGQGSLELALEEKTRRLRFLYFLYTAGSDIPDYSRGWFGA